MRIFQIILFVLGGASFIVSLFLWNEDFWKIGVAILLFDIMCIKLWPIESSEK